MLNDDDKRRLENNTEERIESPAVVEQLHYIVFEQNKDKVNDSVEEYLRDNRPDLIDGDKFADGVLIVGVGLDPRQSFVFAGEDVANVLDLHADDAHAKGTADAIKPGVKDNNIGAGIFAGADYAMDLEQLSTDRYDAATSSRNKTMLGIGAGAGGAGLVAALGGGFVVQQRSRKAEVARAELDLVSKEYGELAQRLDQIDIRAHSLTSTFADDAMRSQWADVRDRFLDIHRKVDKLGELDQNSEDAEFRKYADEIAEAAETTAQLHFAEDNINKLFSVEHGDADARREELKELGDDVSEALLAVDDVNTGLYRGLVDIRERLNSLSANPEDPNFLDDYARLLDDYRLALEEVRKKEFSKVKADAMEPEAPAIFERNWRVGYGHNYFVPFWTMHTWAAQNSTGSGSGSSGGGGLNGGFSSGFSGAGGSSSF